MAPTIVDLTDDSPPPSPATPKPMEPAALPSPAPAPADPFSSSAPPVMGENQLDQLRHTPEQKPPQPDPKRLRLSEDVPRQISSENNIAVSEPDSLYSYYQHHGGLTNLHSLGKVHKHLMDCTNSKPPAVNLGESPLFFKEVVPGTRIAMRARGHGGAPLVVPASTFYEKADRKTGGDHIPWVGSSPPSGSWMPVMDEAAHMYLGSSLPRVLMDLLEPRVLPQRQMIPAAALSRAPVVLPQRQTLILFPMEIPFFPVTPHERAREELRIAAMAARAGQGTSAYTNGMTVSEDRESVGDNDDEEVDLELSLSVNHV